MKKEIKNVLVRAALMQVLMFCPFVTTVYAQTDTLYQYFTGTPVLGTVGVGGYLSGNNGRGDKAKMMKFDANMGLTNEMAEVTDVLLWMPVKKDNGGNFKVKMWTFLPGTTVGPELGSITVAIADIDTNVASSIDLGIGKYNVAVHFPSPILIPASHEFLVGIELPTTPGDTVALMSNDVFDFSLCPTNTFEIWSDDYFNTVYAGWSGLQLAFAVFPIVNSALGVNTISKHNVKLGPNPAVDELIIYADSKVENVKIISLDGKMLKNVTLSDFESSAKINVDSIVSGNYICEVRLAGGEIAQMKFVKL